jgi:hypothetical protein
MTTEALPTLWLYWEGPRPPLVDLCIRSIERHNPTTRLIGPRDVAAMSDSGEVRSITRRLSPAFRSNLLRVWLIWKFGGVWVDADTICTAPIELVPLAADYDLVAVNNPGFAARETPIGGRTGSPVFAETYKRYAQVLRRYHKHTALQRLLRAHVPFPNDPGLRPWIANPAAGATSVTLPDKPYYPFLYRQIAPMMLSRGRGLDPAAAVLWPLNHHVYRRLAAWDERRLMRCHNFLGACLRHAFRM